MLFIILLTFTTIVVKASHLTLGEVRGFQQEPTLISQSVGLHEVPTKIIKITKTVAIKVPVPYPVKVPHHIPVPVPVNRPVAVPVPQIVKVPHHVPIEVTKHIPVELHQQIPLVISRPFGIPQPIPVPHPVNIDRPIYYPVSHPVPFQNFDPSEDHVSYGHENHDTQIDYRSNSEDPGQHESRSYSYYTVESPHNQDNSNSGYSQPENHSNDDFQPSQSDYNADHH